MDRAYPMSQPDIVIITRTRNRPVFLRRAAESICAQTYVAFAWVIVNDGGDPAPVDAIASSLPASLPCEVIHLAENGGMEAAGNRGMEAALARGATYAALHDDDDRWAPEFLAEMIRPLAEDGRLAGAVCCWQEVRESASGEGWKTDSERDRQDPGPLTLSRLAVRNRYPPIALLFRRQAWEAAGRFSEDMPVLGDWDFNLRLLAEGDFARVDKVLAFQHVRGAAKGQASNSIVAARDLHKAMRTRLINRYIRQDMAAGRPGLGHLLAQADILEDGLSRTSLKARVQRLFGKSGEAD